MVKITNYSDWFYSPDGIKDLEELIIFPDGEYRRKGLPNSSVWVFNTSEYQSWILNEDVGCGITAFFMKSVDVRKAADKIAEHMAGKGILRGNHFIDICEKFEKETGRDYQMLLIHSDCKNSNTTIPKTIEEAVNRVEEASKSRENLGYELFNLIGTNGEKFSDWPHNTVEKTESGVIYRKGTVKVEPNKMHILPAHVGECIAVYALDTRKEGLPYSSMPHATGRKGPLGDLKMDSSEVGIMRKLTYIPDSISDSSLRSEHPSCYNSSEKCFDKLRNFVVLVGDTKILAYVGKV